MCEAVDDMINGDSVSNINNISIPNSVTSPCNHAIQEKPQSNKIKIFCQEELQPFESSL